MRAGTRDDTLPNRGSGRAGDVAPFRGGGRVVASAYLTCWVDHQGEKAGPRVVLSAVGESSGGRGWRCAAAGCESHERGVEVDVGGGALCAGGVAGELVLVAGPGAVGDLLSDAGVDDDGELGGGAFDAGTELGLSPVLGCGEDRGGQRVRARGRRTAAASARRSPGRAGRCRRSRRAGRALRRAGRRRGRR
jgi:hypothetical protein